MPCEKYSGWLTDAALGELRTEREPELLAHAMECDACREALSHARQVRDFVDRGVESLVAGEPSPHIRHESAAPHRAGIRIAALPMDGMGTSHRRRPRARHRIWQSWSRANLFTTDPNLSLASTVNPISAPPEAVTASATNPQNAEQTTRTHDRGRSSRVRPLTTALPEIIVPKGQLSAAAELSAAIVTGRVDGSQLLAARQEYDKPLEVKAIEIAPMETPALDTVTEKSANSIQF